METDTGMTYNTIVIVGIGLIGGSLGQAFRRRHPGARIIGVSSPGAIATALETGTITEGVGYEELESAVRDADLVLLCTPIHRIQGLITTLAPMLRPGVVVSDVGSTKREIVRHAEETFPAGVHFIGGHPMAGSEKRGVEAADPFLFQNAMYVLCPAAGVPDEVVARFGTFLGGTGATVITLDAALHDRIAAAVSHLPQLLAVALVEFVGEQNGPEAPYLRLAAGGFRDMTRIASSPYGMWADIFSTNDDAVREAIDAFIERLHRLRDRVGDPLLAGNFEVANLARSCIPQDSKGFMAPLFEILVVVEDKPGVIAHIAVMLADAGINIKDIEILKVREGEGGTLRLAFEKENVAARAIELLGNAGYHARMRR